MSLDPACARRPALGEAPLFVRQVGEGEPLLLVHGLLLTGEMFEPVVPALARRHRLLIPDLRAHGDSASLPGPYTTARMAADLVRLLDRLAIPSAHVLGYSQGGAIALQLARDHPERVRRLVLSCTWASNTAPLRTRAGGALLPRMLRVLGAARTARLLLSLPGIGGGPRLPAATRRRVQEIMAGNANGRVLEAIRASAFDSRAWLSEVASPTLVICGSDDRAAPASHAALLARGIPDARLQVVSGAGHTLIWTHPDELAELTVSWLSEKSVS